MRRALEQPISSTARHILGLSEIAELPREQAIEALVTRSRRYAVYQLRWMQRIPGVIALDGNRSPEQLANEILSRR